MSVLEIKEKYAEHFRKELTCMENRLESLQIRFTDETDQWIVENLTRTIAKLKDEMREVRLRQDIFLKIDEKVKENEICPICMESFDNITVNVTDCGHFICKDCCETILNGPCNARKCPMCRKAISFDTVTTIDKANGANGAGSGAGGDAKEKDEDTNAEIKTSEGTKMDFLVNDVRRILSENESNRVIVFSVWDVMLRRIGNTLDRFGVSNCFIQGGAFTIAKNIHRFRSKDQYKVIMLSADRDVSGLNLTNVTHIYLLDSINVGQIQETQAIGRAVRLGQSKRVEIIRPVIRDTIEERNYSRHVGQAL
jgi:hypothetical protein